jgi:hypothetical protein
MPYPPHGLQHQHQHQHHHQHQLLSTAAPSASLTSYAAQGGFSSPANYATSNQGDFISAQGNYSSSQGTYASPQNGYTPAQADYTPSQDNYALDPNRQGYGSSATALAHTYPRQMPPQSSPRRHSAYETANNVSAHTRTLHYTDPQRLGGGFVDDTFVASRSAPLLGQDDRLSPPLKPDPDASQYNLVEDGVAWNFHTMDGSQDQSQQYFEGDNPAPQWPHTNGNTTANAENGANSHPTTNGSSSH